MSIDESHRGAEAPGLGSTPVDARVYQLFERILEQPLASSAHRPVADSLRVLANQKQQFSYSNPLSLGVVVHALPHIGWYKVQMSDMGGWCGACKLSHEGLLPIGPREGNVIPSGSRVLVMKQPNIDIGVIIGVVPHQREDGKVAVSTWISQGTGVGITREKAHQQVFKGMFRDGGVMDFSCQAPIDATSMDWVKSTETGLALVLTPFEIMVRVNEMCGLFLSLLDSNTVLAGWNLELQSSVGEIIARHDEGECIFQENMATYPWEATGLFSPGERLYTEFSDDDVHFNKYKGKIDLPDGDEDVKPFYRVRRYGGYLGQGGQRLVVAPKQRSGKNKYASSEDNNGVFAESIGLDGSYLLQSAKSIIIAKRCKIEVPEEKDTPESPAGDDAEKNNYRFSGRFGSGTEHRIGDIRVTGEHRHVIKVAGIQDIIAHATNWKRLHAFHYHSNDYRVPQEGENTSPFDRVSEILDYSELEGSTYLKDATPVLLHIDHRYSEVEYYQRESFLAFLDDGSVSLTGGCGEEITMSGGVVSINSPGDIRIIPGCNVLIHGGGVIIKSHDSIDISSSTKDLRLHAYKNLQIIGRDNVLIESQKETSEQLYKDRIGEDVEAGGIVLKSKSVAAILGTDVYIRSGASDTKGDIVFDSSRMAGDIITIADNCHGFVKDAINIWHMTDIDGVAEKSHRFARDASEHYSALIVAGSALIGACQEGSLLVDGSIVATKSIASGGGVASKSGGMLGKIPDDKIAEINRVANEACQKVQEFVTVGDSVKEGKVTNKWYQEGQLGNEETIKDIAFSYRDSDSPGQQYKTQNLKFAEARWQMYARLGGATGGKQWEENPIEYQGRQLYPWPGRVKWQGDSSVFLRLDGLKLFDTAMGRDRDRPGQYESPVLGNLDSTTMQEGIRIIRS